MCIDLRRRVNAEMRMHIYNAWRNPHTTGIDHDLAAGVEARTHCNNFSAIHDDIGILETLTGSR